MTLVCLIRGVLSSLRLRVRYVTPAHDAADMRALKTTEYFRYTRQRPDRAAIRLQWIAESVWSPEREAVQEDGRIRRWRYIPEAQHFLRVILLADGETVHNAFFDRRFTR